MNISCYIFYFKKEAFGMMNEIVYWVRKDNSALHLPNWSGITPTNSLAVPMMLLCILLELENLDASLTQKEYGSQEDWCVEQLKAHIQARVFSTVNRTSVHQFNRFNQTCFPDE